MPKFFIPDSTSFLPVFLSVFLVYLWFLGRYIQITNSTYFSYVNCLIHLDLRVRIPFDEKTLYKDAIAPL